MHEVLVNRLGGLSLPRKSVVRLTDRPDMTLDVYRGRKTTTQQQQQRNVSVLKGNLVVLCCLKAPESGQTKIADQSQDFCDKDFSQNIAICKIYLLVENRFFFYFS